MHVCRYVESMPWTSCTMHQLATQSYSFRLLGMISPQTCTRAYKRHCNTMGMPVLLLHYTTLYYTMLASQAPCCQGHQLGGNVGPPIPHRQTPSPYALPVATSVDNDTHSVFDKDRPPPSPSSDSCAPQFVSRLRLALTARPQPASPAPLPSVPAPLINNTEPSLRVHRDSLHHSTPPTLAYSERHAGQHLFREAPGLSPPNFPSILQNDFSQGKRARDSDSFGPERFFEVQCGVSNDPPATTQVVDCSPVLVIWLPSMQSQHRD